MMIFDWYFQKRRIKYIYLGMLFRLRGYDIGKFFMVGKGVVIEKKGFKAGDCVYIGPRSYIGPDVELGNFCMFSDGINFIGDDHVYDHVSTPIILAGRPDKLVKTIVGDDVWIGHAVTIMRGVVIGEGSVIASNTVVTKDIAPYTIVAGTPAKVIRQRFNDYGKKKHSDFLKQYREGEMILVHDRKPKYKFAK